MMATIAHAQSRLRAGALALKPLFLIENLVSVSQSFWVVLVVMKAFFAHRSERFRRDSPREHLRPQNTMIALVLGK